MSSQFGLKGCNDRATEIRLDEVLDLGRLEGLDQLGNPGFVLVDGAYCQQIRVGTVCVFQGNGIAGGNQIGLDSVIGIDCAGIEVVQEPRQLGGLDLDDSERT